MPGMKGCAHWPIGSGQQNKQDGAYLVRAKKERPATMQSPTIMFRRPAPAKRQNSMPPASTATAEPPEKAADICTHRQMLLMLLISWWSNSNVPLLSPLKRPQILAHMIRQCPHECNSAAAAVLLRLQTFAHTG